MGAVHMVPGAGPIRILERSIAPVATVRLARFGRHATDPGAHQPREPTDPGSTPAPESPDQQLPRTLRTKPKDLNSVRNLSKTVFTAQTGSPALDSRSLNLHSLAAVTANQMMVVVFSFAAAVQNLTVSTTENINLLVISHGLEDPVGGSQRDFLAAVLKQTVKLLGTYKVIKRIQSTPNSQPLPGNPGLGSPPRGRWLR